MRRLQNRKNYIGLLKECLSVRDDFADLVYHRDSTTGEETLILSDIIGKIIMLDVTNNTETQMLTAIAEIVTGKAPVNLITDKAEMMRIARSMQ